MLKYTPHDHPDRITLQMALARFEGIADYLNESKRITKQWSIVEYLNNRVSKPVADPEIVKGGIKVQ